MKKALLLAPIILSLTSCSSSLEKTVKKSYEQRYGITVVQIEKTAEYESVSVWFIIGEKDKYLRIGEYMYNGFNLRKIWELEEDIL